MLKIALSTKTLICGVGVVSVVIAASLTAHPDDPKGKDRLPAYRGPGFRKAVHGAMYRSPFDSEGVELMSWLPLGEFAGSHENGNDCWGYVSASGREYAIMGLHSGTGFVEITDPGNAQVIETILSDGSLWGDVKVFQDYAYAVTDVDAAVGVQIIDMSDIDNGNVTLVNTIEEGSTGETHNVAINAESGYLYRTGGDYYGLAIYDLNPDPVNPQLVSTWELRYVHDAEIVTMTEGPFAGKEIAFCCSGDNYGWTDPGLDILDVTNKDNITVIARYIYPDGAYSHQLWLSEDRNYAYIGDELDESDYGIPTNTKIIDISNLFSPFFVKKFSNGNPAIDHNLYIRDGYIFEANYRSGLRIFDASDPENPFEVGHFDTFPDDDNPNYNGLWSNYPFFPSGTVIGSDMQRGLFVWKVDVLQATGDVNGDGTVDVTDLLAVLAAWGPCPGCPEDTNSDGVVDVLDLMQVLADWS